MAEAKKRTALHIIRSYDGPKIRIMEVCGTHTHEIFRQGIRQILPPQVDVISGPGCPVCVTPVGYIDQAIWLALEKGVTICTFGDLVRVPGSTMSLADARSQGGHVEIVYSPFDAYDYAKAHPDEDVVFLSVGFETTTPPSCLAVRQAVADGMTNFSLLTAFAVILVKFPQGKPFFKNCYPRVVKDEGSPAAQALIKEVMEPCDSEWRGLGVIPQSGLQLRPAFAVCDARKKYNVPAMEGRANPACRCGDILQGKCTPPQCPLFGKVCTPEHPVGACMVSHEGACSAYYLYGGNLHE